MHQSVSELLRNGGVIIYTAPSATVAEATKKMAFHNVSSILVLENNETLVGIFTERDLLRRVVVEGLDPNTTQITDVMTPNVMVVTRDTPLGQVHLLMKEKHIRHIPVADKDRLLGVISFRDLLRFENQEKDFEINQLKDYVLHKPYPVYPG